MTYMSYRHVITEVREQEIYHYGSQEEADEHEKIMATAGWERHDSDCDIPTNDFWNVYQRYVETEVHVRLDKK